MNNLYSYIPKKAIFDNNISFGAKIILSILIGSNEMSIDDKRELNYSNEFLANIVSLSESQVKRLLKELKENNYIKIVVNRKSINGIVIAKRTIILQPKKWLCNEKEINKEKKKRNKEIKEKRKNKEKKSNIKEKK